MIWPCNPNEVKIITQAYKKILPCKPCKEFYGYNTAILKERFNDEWFIKCLECGRETYILKGLNNTIKKWNDKNK